MAYLSKADLATHLYAEIVQEIIRDYRSEFASLEAFPANGITGIKYIAVDTSKIYRWTGTAYEETAEVDIVAKAINSGVGLAKSHLNRYDKVAMFGDFTTPEAPVEPTFKDDYLDSLVKDIVCWHLLKLANPNIELALFRTAYEDAVAEFVKIKKGLADPEWPLAPNNPDTEIDEAGNVEYSSNLKRTNHF